MGDPLDAEISSILYKLGKIQDEVGGGKKSATLGQGLPGADQFMEMALVMKEHLELVKQQIEEVKNLEKSFDANPKDKIAQQSKLRQEMTSLNDEWKTLEGCSCFVHIEATLLISFILYIHITSSSIILHF